VNETDWEPADDEIEWTRTNLEPLKVGGVWSPHGLEYEKTGDKAIRLVTMVNHEGVAEAHARVSKVLTEHMGWTMDDDSVERIVNQPTPEDIAANQEAELQRIQEIVSSWVCPDEDCAEPLVNMPLEQTTWLNLGLHSFTDPESGEVGESDRWVAEVCCHKCSQTIPMNPLDYGYIAGEDLFYTWRVPNTTIQYRVLPREECTALIDSGGKGVALGSTLGPVDVPPHMQGTYCVRSEYTNDEEE
tara:strand:- start:2406 stop:3137 length:732 start_codon:yes stop_codon:yes gene_type:complete